MAEVDVGRLEQDVAEIKQDVRRLAGDVDEVKADVRRLAEGQAALSERVAGVEGELRQMDKRLGSLESLQRWALGMYAVLILAVLGLYFKGSL